VRDQTIALDVVANMISDGFDAALIDGCSSGNIRRLDYDGVGASCATSAGYGTHNPELLQNSRPTDNRRGEHGSRRR
jgi:hypothetical protein